MKDDVGKVLVVVLVLASVAAVLFGAIAGRLSAHGGGNVADVDTVGYDRCGFGGLDSKGYGRWNDPASDTRKRGEVFTTGRLWYAWWEDGTSRPVTTAAFLLACGFLGMSAPEWVLYRFSYRESTTASWTGFAQDTIPNGVDRAFVTFQGTGVGLAKIDLPPVELILDGFTFFPCTYPTAWTDTARMGCTPGTSTQSIKDGAALRVEVIVERKGFPGNYGPTLIATDEVELRSPIPHRFEWASGGYKVGQVAVLNYEVPVTEYELCTSSGTCSYAPAYFITISDMNTNAPISGWDRTPVTNRQGSVRVDVEAGFFSNDLAVCQNRLRAQLYTEIILINQDDTAVKSNSTTLAIGDAPRITEVTFDKEEYQEGDTVTIEWTSEGNVTRYHVTAQTAGLVALDEDFGFDTTTTNFRAAATGILEVEVTPYNLCQPGDVKEVQATIGNVLPELCEIFPEALDCDDSVDWLPYLIAGLAFVAVLVSFLIGFYVTGKLREDVEPVWQLLGGILAGGGVAFVLAIVGAFDALLGV